MRSAIVIALFAACSVERGRVDVIVYSKLNPGTRATGAHVVFTDVDGTTSESMTVDGDGRVAGYLEDGGTVWVAEGKLGNSPTMITAFTGVTTGSELQIGTAPDGYDATVHATMLVSAVVPAGADRVFVRSNCSPLAPSAPDTIMFDGRCGNTADIVVLAIDAVGGVTGTVLVRYAYYPAYPIVDGGMLTVDPTAWKEPVDVALTFTNGTVSDYSVYSSLSSYGANGAIALAGTLNVGASTDTSAFQLAMPPAASATFDLDAILPSTVTVAGELTAREWHVDDNRRVDAVVVDSSWVLEPLPGNQTQVIARVISPPATDGTAALPRLPDELADWRPAEIAYDLIPAMGKLVRFEGFENPGPQLVELTNVDTYGSGIVQGLQPMQSAAWTPL